MFTSYLQMLTLSICSPAELDTLTKHLNWFDTIKDEEKKTP